MRGGRSLTYKELLWCRRNGVCYDCGKPTHPEIAQGGVCPSTDAECEAWKKTGITAAMSGNANSATLERLESLERRLQVIVESDERSGSGGRAPQRQEDDPDCNETDRACDGRPPVSAEINELDALEKEMDELEKEIQKEKEKLKGNKPSLAKAAVLPADAPSSPAEGTGAVLGSWCTFYQKARQRQQTPLGGWTVSYRPITPAEAMGHPNRLHLFLAHPGQEFTDPVAAPWVWGNNAATASLLNATPLRPPREVTAPDGSRRVDMTQTTRDMAVAYMKMASGQFDELAIDARIEELLRDQRWGEQVEELKRQLTCNRATPPAFMCDFDLDELRVAESQRMREPTREVSFLSVCCGVSGEALAMLASGVPQHRMTFVEVCPQNTDFLRRQFPCAEIIECDIMNAEAQAYLVSRFKGSVDIGMSAQLCDPTSAASAVHDAGDPRLEVGRDTVRVMLEIDPCLFITENVASFDETQEEAYRDCYDCVAAHYGECHRVDLNAKHCLLPQQRNRMFLMGARGIDLAPMHAAVAWQKRLRAQGVQTHQTLRECWAPLFMREIRGKKGAFYPHMRRSPRDKHRRPKRGYSLDRPGPTVTGHCGGRGSNTEVHRMRYKGSLADDAKPHELVAPTPSMWGAACGFCKDAPWSQARRCYCVGCKHPSARRHSGETPGETQRGNVICPQQMHLMAKHLVRAFGTVCEQAATPRQAVSCRGCVGKCDSDGKPAEKGTTESDATGGDENADSEASQESGSTTGGVKCDDDEAEGGDAGGNGVQSDSAIGGVDESDGAEVGSDADETDLRKRAAPDSSSTGDSEAM